MQHPRSGRYPTNENLYVKCLDLVYLETSLFGALEAKQNEKLGTDSVVYGEKFEAKSRADRDRGAAVSSIG